MAEKWFKVQAHPEMFRWLLFATNIIPGIILPEVTQPRTRHLSESHLHKRGNGHAM